MAVLQRTCIGCWQVRTREDLIRIVRSPVDGAIVIDSRGKEKGRGAYVCFNIDCINKAMQPQKLDRAFRVDHIGLETIDRLRQDLLELTEVRHC